MAVRARDADDHEAFVTEVEPRLPRALIAQYRPDRGREATTEALGWACAHWSRVKSMANPAGYLFRVGQSRIRRRREPAVPVDRPEESHGLNLRSATLPDRRHHVIVQRLESPIPDGSRPFVCSGCRRVATVERFDSCSQRHTALSLSK
jgi:hypothetical protein